MLRQMQELSIYNSLGQEIEELLNSVQNSGNYSVNWNAEKLCFGNLLLFSFEVIR
jgi:hypothetical protein